MNRWDRDTSSVLRCGLRVVTKLYSQLILKRDGEVLLKSRMREIGTFGSVRGLIVTWGLLHRKEVRYGLYSTLHELTV